MSNNDQKILLEAGTNELEVLVFTLGPLRCGVNVAKVREVIGRIEPTHVPCAHPAVVGVSNLRGQVIPLVDLHLYFHPGETSASDVRHVIITEFNDLLMGFVVDGVEQIYRLSWDKVEPAPLSQQSAAVTSICHINDKLVLMIDFERIAFDIQGMQVSAEKIGEAGDGVERATCRLILAEDSPTMRNFLQQTLTTAGYENVKVTGDGQEAWEAIEATVNDPMSPRFDVIVSDIEMPRMDGLHLCRRVRENPQLRDTPIVIFSSLVSDDNLKKMAQVGADRTLTKPQLVELVRIVDELMTQRQPAMA